jgi:hypothetical protein
MQPRVRIWCQCRGVRNLEVSAVDTVKYHQKDALFPFTASPGQTIEERCGLRVPRKYYAVAHEGSRFKQGITCRCWSSWL